MQKTLEGAKLKLGNVVSYVMGQTSRMILWAIADGERDPARFVTVATGRKNSEKLP